MESIKLNNGVEMPTVGIGVFTITPDEAESSPQNSHGISTG